MTPTQKLEELGLRLPPPTTPVGSYVPATQVGELILTSGQIPLVDGRPTCTGTVGQNVSLEQAQEATRICLLNALSAVTGLCGSLDRVARVIRVCVYVASTSDFTAQPKVANAASDLLVEIFGEAGKHVRSAVGVSSLPLEVPVELELVVQLQAAA